MGTWFGIEPGEACLCDGQNGSYPVTTVVGARLAGR